MSRIASKPRHPAPRRTRCNVAALVAIGALASTAAPGWAATASSSLPANTIPVLRGIVSDYSKSATFSTTTGTTGQTLTINQLLPKIVLDWNSFNIANGSTVQFVQPSASAAVLNRIYDGNPTVIEGSIKANGQVYLVNQNGILFNRGAQINTNTFVASSLNIDDSVFTAGLTSGAPTFAGGYDVTGKTVSGVKTGAIVVGADGAAAAAAPTITAQSGGAVIIIAPVIDNRSGIITSPDGQVILAAGNSAYLSFSATNTPGAPGYVRGMTVQVNADAGDVDLTSMIHNAGTITSDRGNVTLAGLAINQEGRISASSAMLTNGSIFLQATTQDKSRNGRVTLAAGSVTETPLDLTDTTTLSDSTSFAAYRPVVQVTGQTIDVEGRITSPSGRITLDAEDPSLLATPRIYLGAASVVDASGVWSTASDASNLLTFKVTSSELKDSPDQKGGLLAGATVTVDLREDSSLLDLSGYQANQARTLQQKAAQGGVVTLTSAGDVVQRAGSVVDVSGGGVHYTGATESTTKLIGADGKLYDIMTAPEALAYTGIANSYVQKQTRWGYSQTFDNLLVGTSLKRPDFDSGADGGTLTIDTTPTATGLVLDGTLRGGITSGSQQSASAPRGGTLVIGDTQGKGAGVGDVTFMTSPAATLAAGSDVTVALTDSQKTSTTLSTDVFAAGRIDAAGNYVSTGFDTVTINADGRVTVPENVTIKAPAGGSLTMNAAQVEVDGRIEVPSGTVAAAAKGSVVVAQGASIDTSGTWINNALAGTTSPLPSAVLDAQGTSSATSNGGTISLAGSTVDLEAQSTLDVSAGGSMSTRGVFTGGSGGAISLGFPANATAPADGASSLTLDGTLAGYGFAAGGTLSLSTNSKLQIAQTGSTGGSTGLNLGTAFFDEGGFQSYVIASAGDLTVESGAVIRPRQLNLQIDLAHAQALATGANVASASRFVTLADNVRKPTSLSLASSAELSIQAQSAVVTDVGGAVSLSATKGASIDGSVLTPGGSISVTVTGAAQAATTPVLELGSTGVLAARGAFTATPSDAGLVQGTLAGGGSISLTAKAAQIQLDAGSLVDVSGTSQAVDVPNTASATSPYREVVQYGNAGTVAITANDVVTLGGALRGTAGGSAAGGSFALTLTERGDLGDPTTGRRILVTQSGAAQASDASFKDVTVSVDKLEGSGFDKLRLSAEDQIVFADDATLAFRRGVTLDTKLIEVANGANVLVTGAAVNLANSMPERIRSNPDDPTDLSTTTQPQLASAPQASTVGTGTFQARAGTLGVTGSVTIDGTKSTTLAATGDLQLSGRTVGTASGATGAQLVGSLTTAGDLTLSAAQVYPTTASTFTVAVADGLTGALTPGGHLTVTRGAGVAGDVFSAGGSLTMKADDIAQDGTVEAPLGTLSLQAGSTLTLGATSVTSVSANGLTIPYGETQNGITWTYAPTGNDPTTASLTAPPAKNISLSGPAVDVLSGAKVDVSGGGDVAGIEWVPGSGGGAGGAVNELLQPGTYAIIPAAKLSSAPVDPDLALVQNLGFGKDGAVYNSVRIGAGGPVPAGDYVLLPSYYGLLQGGYLVQVLTGSKYANLQSGQTATLQNGQKVVSGVMTAAGTDVAASTTVGVVITPGSEIAKLGEYTLTGSAYFAKLADASRSTVPALPTDGGQLSIAATQRLTMQGTLVADLPTADSRGAEVDITASRIALVDQVGRSDVPSDYLQIDSTGLSNLGASLLIGGTRSLTSAGEVVTATATDIVVANSAAHELKSPELVLAATNSITVDSGSVIEGSGGHAVNAPDFTIGGAGAASGAVLRVSNAGLVNITRPATDASQGSITIAAGATVAATSSVALDATRTTSSSGTFDIAAGGALALVSGTVSLGQTDGVAGLDSGLVLDNAALASLGALGTLSIKSYNGLALFGDAQVGSASLGNLVIDSAALTGRAAADGTAASALVAGRNVSLVNTSGLVADAGAANGSAGALTISAAQITVGAGSKSVSGFGDLRLDASGEILAAGTGTLQTASPLELSAARIGSVSGANQAWSAQAGSGLNAQYAPVTITAVAPAAALADSTALGSRLQVSGSSIVDGGDIAMKAGSVTLQAMGPAATDGVLIQSGATIDAGGAAKSFQGSVATADAGQVQLSAANGAVRLVRGSSVDVAAAAAGGDAGSFSVVATSVDLSGTLQGGSAKGTQGSASVDVASLADFSTLNATLNGAGFTESRDVRVRTGDLVVAAGDVVTAHHQVLESDTGTVRVLGRLDASAPLGAGSVEVDGRSVDIGATALIDASGTSTDASTAASPYANGGAVTLVAEGGTLNFAAGAVVDVRAGAKGSAGSVLLRAPRTSTSTGMSVAATLAGQVLSQRHAGDAAAAVTIEGNRVYDLGAAAAVVDQAAIAGFGNDNTAFMSQVDAAGLAAGIRGDDGAAQANVHVRPAVEVVAQGDLQVTANWNLTGAGWRITPAGATAAEAGSLLVRAAGDLTLASAAIGNPDTSLQTGATWNIALVGGADTGAANGLRTQSAGALAAQASTGQAGAGNLVLDSANAEASVRTGTGAIHLAAGRDFVIQAGTDAQGDPLVGVVYTSGVAAIKDPVVSAANSRFAQGGGDITITAQRDAIGAGDEWMTDWYRANNAALTGGAWWAYRPNFHDGVAALGGGNVTITAGRDVNDLSAWVPTSAIESGSGTSLGLTTFGGGNLSVRAGNDIVGGQYLLSLGKATIDAGGDIGGAGVASQLFLMGASGDAALAGAAASLNAGGAIVLNTIDNPASIVQYQSVGSGPSFSVNDYPLSVLSYAANSRATLRALGGNIRVGNQPAAAALLNPSDSVDGDVLGDQSVFSSDIAVLPSQVDFTSFNGSIAYTGDSTGVQVLFPSASGYLKLLAARDITGMSMIVSDRDPTQFDIQNISQQANTSYGSVLALSLSSSNRIVTNTSTDTFIDDVVALGGDVANVVFTFPARSRIWAARDVSNPLLQLQNLGSNDLSEVVADTGSITVTRGTDWAIAGPGTLLLQAGENVSLGSAPLTSSGNTVNTSLASTQGASIDVVAGKSGVIDPAQVDALFAKLVAAGQAKSTDDATAAVNAFFGTTGVGKGDIDSYNTSIQSNAGGSINLLAPGGNITVGLPAQNNNKLIGVVTNAGGAIRSYLSGDFDINQGKVLTAQGGDILIYTSGGGIDAGRGARTSVTTPPPTRTAVYDTVGNLIGFKYTLPVAVSGSGIQTATSKPGGPTSVAPPAGNIYLFAPAGTIDAGEAGIASGGAIFITALTVLNADNITSVGASTGVPQVVAGSAASTAAASGATTATNSNAAADAVAQAAAAAAAAGVTNFRPAILTVEVLGFGEKNCKEQDKDCLAK